MSSSNASPTNGCWNLDHIALQRFIKSQFSFHLSNRLVTKFIENIMGRGIVWHPNNGCKVDYEIQHITSLIKYNKENTYRQAFDIASSIFVWTLPSTGAWSTPLLCTPWISSIITVYLCRGVSRRTVLSFWTHSTRLVFSIRICS